MLYTNINTIIVPSALITMRAYNLQHKERYNIVIGEEMCTFAFYNKSIGTVYCVILFNTCSYFHYVYNIVHRLQRQHHFMVFKRVPRW